ncbi:MAG: molybdenum cofactor biosynthesis protein B [Halanaerobiales bacterium]
MIRVALIAVGNKNPDFSILEDTGVGEILNSFDGEVVYLKNITEDFGKLQEELFTITEKGIADLLLTTGGTGFARKNITPEATMAVIEKETPGITELMRKEVAARFPSVSLTRGRAGIRKSTLIINLPDEKNEIIESLKCLCPIISKGIEILKKDYNNHKYHELKLW